MFDYVHAEWAFFTAHEYASTVYAVLGATNIFAYENVDCWAEDAEYRRRTQRRMELCGLAWLRAYRDVEFPLLW